MDDPGPDEVKQPASLKTALRAARLEEAERAQAVGDLRGAEVGRLGLLRDAIEPVLRQVPVEVEMFDAGIVAGGERPRLFIDMISFVEMGRDRRSYRFLQDTRHGRVMLAETEGVGTMTTAITQYIARRLVEREQTLASLLPDGLIRRHPAEPASGVPDKGTPDQIRAAPPRGGESPSALPTSRRPTMRILRLGIDALGILALAAIFWLGLQFVLGRFPPQ